MIYLKLFLNYLMIGALSFGGGYGMVSLVRETVISIGWLTENEFLNFIAVSESTPGPLAVNDYPELNSEITVTGTFETYDENGFKYCRLKDAAIVE